MKRSGQTTVTIEAQLHTSAATAQLTRIDVHEAGEHIMREQALCWLDLCLTPRLRGARACYPDRWSAHRFVQIGELFFVPAGATLHARTEVGTLTSLVCRIDPQLITKWFEGDLQWTERRLGAALDIRDTNIRCLLMRLTTEVIHPGFASEMLLELIAAQLAIELRRYCTCARHFTCKSGLAAWRLSLIDERVRQLGKAPSLAELADLCSLSVRQLSRGFRVSRDCSIGHYVEQSRIEQAKRLLIAGESAQTVAHSLGFSSPSSFSYAFRRATGLCPRRFRQLAGTR